MAQLLCHYNISSLFSSVGVVLSPPPPFFPVSKHIHTHIHKELIISSNIITISFLISSTHTTHINQSREEMAIMSAHQLAFMFGLLGNIVSFMVFLAPLPTFYRIFKKKTTEGFHSIPYSVALFSCMLMLFYAFLKTSNGVMLITINSIGCVIEAFYLTIFMIYAPRSFKIQTTKLLIFFNVGLYGLIIGSTLLFVQVSLRVTVVGWICAVFSVSVFAAPLSIMRLVIRTKSVEYMPFTLSLFLTLCAVMWFCYGLLIKDFYIALPNVLGFLFGIAQMTLYVLYKDNKKILPEFKLQELPTQVELKSQEITQEKLPNNTTEIVIVLPEDTTAVKGNADQKMTATESAGDLNV